MLRIRTRLRVLRFQLHAGYKSFKSRWHRRPSDLLDRYRRAMAWIHQHSLSGTGISVSDVQHVPYPEVSGYFIPTLLQWGERDLAFRYARWLVSIQNPDGSWSDPQGSSPYTF